MEKAEEHILLVSANLDAEVISTVQKNQGELKQYANVPERKIFHITTSGHDPFEKIVSQVIHFMWTNVERSNITNKYKCGLSSSHRICALRRQW